MKAWPKVAVIGASIGGLTAALVLRGLGGRVDVLERSQFRHDRVPGDPSPRRGLYGPGRQAPTGTQGLPKVAIRSTLHSKSTRFSSMAGSRNP